jgi:TPR repeat protein
MPVKLIYCVSFPPATVSSVPINDYAEANEELAQFGTEEYYTCCGKSICNGCIDSFRKSGNNEKCPFCNADGSGKTSEERVKEMMKRVDMNDAHSIYVLGSYYYNGRQGIRQDQERAMELWTQAAKLGSSNADFALGKRSFCSICNLLIPVIMDVG